MLMRFWQFGKLKPLSIREIHTSVYGLFFL